MEKLRNWVHEHDDRWSFIILYVGGSIFLSLYMNLFWVAMLMLSHLGLEIWRHRLLALKNPVVHALWHVKLDISLLLFAFVIVLYSDAIVAALGMGQTVRAAQAVRGAQMATRFGIIQRSLRVFLMTADDLARFTRAVLRVAKNGKAGQLPEMATVVAEDRDAQHESETPWRKLTAGDWGSLGFGMACLSLIVVTPFITSNTATDTLELILTQLHP